MSVSAVPAPAVAPPGRDPLALPLAWHGAFVLRWHAHVDFAAFGDTVGAHVARAAALALELWPADHDLLRWVIQHDAAEAVLGDLPAPVRRGFPALARAYAEAEREVNAAAGIRPPSDPVTLQRADLCDVLDRVLWVRRHRPDLGWNEEWRGEARRLLGQAFALGVGDRVHGWLR